MSDYEGILGEIKTRYSAILRKNLTGIYVHGSIAFGCFHWQHSDIDFIAVVEQPLEQEKKLRLLEGLVSLLPYGPAAGIEMSVVLRSYAQHFVYPTPYELHFSKDWLERYRADPHLLTGDEPKTDRDLAAHFTMIRKVGVVLLGPPAAEVFGEVPARDYLDSIQGDVANAREEMDENPLYVILNLCRVAAYRREGRILSKQEGGEWAIEHLEPRFHGLIRRALLGYCSGEPVKVGKQEGSLFCARMEG